jgi:transposase
VDTQEQGLTVKAPRKKLRRRSIKERREIVEETLLAGASVSRVARRHDVNANQVFYWRKLYREGRLGGSKQLLAVEVTPDQSAPVSEEVAAASTGSIEIKVAKGSLRVFGSIDVSALRVVLECLAG